LFLSEEQSKKPVSKSRVLSDNKLVDVESVVELDKDAVYSLEEMMAVAASGTSILVFSSDSMGVEADNDVSAAKAVIFCRFTC